MKKSSETSFFAAFLFLLVLAASGPAFCPAAFAQTRPAEAADATEDYPPDSMTRILDTGVIRIGVYDNSPPMSYIDERGRRQGFEILLAKRVATDLLGNGARVELVLLDPESRIDSLLDGEADILFCGLAVTPENSKQVDFSKPYLKSRLSVISLENAPVTAPEQLEGQDLIVVKGSFAETFFTDNFPEIRLFRCDSAEQAFDALKYGLGRALADDSLTLLAWISENPGYKAGITELGEVALIAPAVKNGDAKLLEWLDQEMISLAQEGFMLAAYNATLRKYSGEEADPGVVLPRIEDLTE